MGEPVGHSAIIPRRLDVDDYYRMAEIGILREDEQIELIGGEILETVGISPPHASLVTRLRERFVLGGEDRVLTSIRNPVRLDRYNEVRPDLALLRWRSDFYASRHPAPTDVLLLVEVADESLAYDRIVKQPRYARHAIPEFWLFDLNTRTASICRGPTPDGYSSITAATAADILEPAALPGLRIPLAGLFG